MSTLKELLKKESRRFVISIIVTTHINMNMNNNNISSALQNLSQPTTAFRMIENCNGRNYAFERHNNIVCNEAVVPNRGNAVEQATKGKSGRDRMCCFPNTRGLHHTSKNTPVETHSDRADELGNSVVCGNAVEQNCGNAIERATRGESGRDKKGCFPNTGGLHRTSGNAPLETHPPYSHVNNSNSPSSRRTQVASSAFQIHRNETTRHSTKHRRNLNANRKKYKQLCHLKDVKICSTALRKVKQLELDYIKKNVVICDGGDNESDGIQNRPNIDGVSCLRICEGVFGLLIQNVH